jgi:hypothetical protein
MNQRPHLDPFLLELPGHRVTLEASEYGYSIGLLCECGTWVSPYGLGSPETGSPELSEALQLAYNHHEVVRNRTFEFTSQ